jgi:DNA-binding protein YbaB
MLRQAKESQERLAEFQAKRAEMRVSGFSEDGLLEAVVDGNGRIADIKIEGRALRLDSFSLAEGLMAAIRSAYAAYDQESEQMIGKVTGDNELFEKIKSGNFDAYEYLRSFGFNMPEVRGMIQ